MLSKRAIPGSLKNSKITDLFAKVLPKRDQSNLNVEEQKEKDSTNKRT